MLQLNNPSFDAVGPTGKPLSSRNGGEMSVEYADGWMYGWQDQKLLYDCNYPGILDNKLQRLTQPFAPANKLGTYSCPAKSEILKPEFNVIQPVIPYLQPPRIYQSKGNALKIFKQWGIIEAWVYQRVKCDPFKSYLVDFTAFAHAWFMSDEDRNAGMKADASTGVPGAFYALQGTPGLSDPERNYLFDVGIDPLGGFNPLAESVVWSKGAHIVNQYHEIPHVTATVGSGLFTVFIRVRNLYGFNNSDAYFDKALLEVEEIEGETTQPKLDYVAVAMLPPQDATDEEMAALGILANKTKGDLFRSYDTARAIVKQALPGSKVVLVGDIGRHPFGVIEWLGVPVEVIPFPKVVEPPPVIVLPPAPPAMTYPRTCSLAGIHVEAVGSHTGYGEMLRRCSEADVPLGVVKSFMDAGSLMEAKSVDKRTITVFRTRPAGSDEDNPLGDWQWPAEQTVTIADKWMFETVQRARPDLHVTDYLEITNEPNGALPVQYERQNAFYLECIKYANTIGIKIAIGGFSAGCPEPWQVDILAPCFAAAARGGHALATHEGSLSDNPLLVDSAKEGTALRYRMIKERLDAKGLPMPAVVITELYWPGGYQGKLPWSDFMWYWGELAKDPYVLGAAYFSLGDHGGTNIVGQLANMTKAIIAMGPREY